jgi:hypothetical protein
MLKITMDYSAHSCVTPSATADQKIFGAMLRTHVFNPPFPNLSSVTSIYESTSLFYRHLR